jgi:hypothetical protein
MEPEPPPPAPQFPPLAWVVPASVPAIVFLVPQVVGGYFVGKWLKGRHFDAHVAAGGPKASSGRGAAIGLVFTAWIIGALAVGFLITGINPRAALLDAQESVDFGHDQLIFYSRGATRDDAQRFGDALVNEGYFDGTTPAEVLIAGRPGAHEISFAGAESAWDDESNVEWMRHGRTHRAGHRGKSFHGAPAGRVPV